MTVAKKAVAPRKTTVAKKTVTKKTTEPSIHAKQITLIVSVGTEDSDRTIEKFAEDVTKAINASKTANVKRVVQASAYYILDGKVCLPADYDPKTKMFKPGATPPPWAGGPVPSNVKPAVVRESAQAPKYLTREEADRRISLAKARNAKPVIDDDEFEDLTEEIGWEAEDATDHEKLGNVADESVKKAVETVTAPAKKRVIKRGSASPAKTAAKPKTDPVHQPRTVFGSGAAAAKKTTPAKKTIRRTK